METENIEKAIATIRERGAVLAIKDGKIVAPVGQLTSEERAFITGHRDAVIDYLSNGQAAAPAAEQSEPAEAPEPEPASAPALCCDRGAACGCFQRGFFNGVEHAQQLGFDAVPKPKRVTTPAKEIEFFRQWQLTKGVYFTWEREAMEALEAALEVGDKIEPRFAYSCGIRRSDGATEEFSRQPPWRK